MTETDEVKIRDGMAEDYDAVYLKHHGRWQDWVEKKVIMRLLDLQPTDTVLDAGYGTGRITLDIATRSRFVFGLDNSAESLRVLRNKADVFGVSNLATIQGDIRDFVWPHPQVDKVVSVQVIQHLPNVSDRRIAIRCLANTLRSGGTCVMSVYNTNSFYLGQLLGRKLPAEGRFPNGLFYHRFGVNELYVGMFLAGFRDIRVFGCVNVSFYERLQSPLFYPVAVLDALVSRLPLSTGLGVYLVARGVKP